MQRRKEDSGASSTWGINWLFGTAALNLWSCISTVNYPICSSYIFWLRARKEITSAFKTASKPRGCAITSGSVLGHTDPLAIAQPRELSRSLKLGTYFFTSPKQSGRGILDFNPLESLGGSGIAVNADRTFCSIPRAESCLFSTECSPITHLKHRKRLCKYFKAYL